MCPCRKKHLIVQIRVYTRNNSRVITNKTDTIITIPPLTESLMYSQSRDPLPSAETNKT